MPSERRNLRSNKETSSSTNGEKGRSNSQSSSAKDKPVPTRSTSSKSKTSSSKKSAGAGKEEKGSKPQTNGTEPVDNGVDGTEDVEMVDDGHPSVNADRDADEEMTVVVPPPKSSKLSGGHDDDPQGDSSMEGNEVGMEGAEKLDPEVKAAAGMICSCKIESCTSGLTVSSIDIKANYFLLERAVTHFDARFTLRVLRSISSVRKYLSSDLLAQIINATYPASSPTARALLAALSKATLPLDSGDSSSAMDIDSQKDKTKVTASPKETIPEIDFYLAILVQIHLFDSEK
ncbi:MAG: hypothetical protein Q9228_005319, partial [Teloschistes exilis]